MKKQLTIIIACSTLIISSLLAITILLPRSINIAPPSIVVNVNGQDSSLGYEGDIATPYIITTNNTNQPATTTEYFGDINPQVNNVYSLGNGLKSWRNVYASGTYYGDGSGLTGLASTLNSLDSPDGDSFFDMGTYALDFYDLNLNGLNWGNGTATSTLMGGAGGLATSTLVGDISIDNLYMGLINLPTDGGIVTAMDMQITNSAATGTWQGGILASDGIPVLFYGQQADSLGRGWLPRIGIATTTPNTGLYVNTSFGRKTRAVTVASSTAQLDDFRIEVDREAMATVELTDESCKNGVEYSIIDGGGHASTNTIYIEPELGSTKLIDGGDSVQITGTRNAVDIYCSGNDGNWHIN